MQLPSPPPTIDRTGDSLAALDPTHFSAWPAPQTNEVQGDDRAADPRINKAAGMVMRMYTNKWRDQGLFQELRQHVAWLLQQRHPRIGSPEAAVGAALTQSWDLVEVDELWSILIAWNTLTRVSLRKLPVQRMGALLGGHRRSHVQCSS